MAMEIQDLERRINDAIADDEVQAYVRQLKDIYAYRPGEPLISLAFRNAKARIVSAKLNTVLRAKHKFSLDDLKNFYEHRFAHLSEVAAAGE